MKIRRSILADCAEMARLHRGTIRQINSKDYPPEIIESWSARTSAKKFRDTHNACIRYVALEGDNIVGFGDLLKEDGNLGGIYIHKDWIGKGVGSALLQKLEDHARKLGTNKFQFSASLTAKPFYESKGYYLIQKRKTVHRYVNGKPFYVYKMGKNL